MALSHGQKRWNGVVAAALLLAGVPLAAQTVPATTVPAPATGASASTPPAPAGNDVVGPATLRDFNLNGTVTRRAEPVAPAQTPTPTPSRRPVPATTAPDRSIARPVAPSLDRPAAPVRAPAATVSGADAAPAPRAPPLGSAAEPAFAGDSPAAPVAPLAAPQASDGLPWAWILAALALAAGAAIYARQHGQSSARYGKVHAGAGAGAVAGAALPAASPAPASAARPVPKPPAAVPARPVPSIAARSAPAAVPRPAAPTAVPREPAPIPGGIVASGLKPKLAFELHPIRADTDAARGAALLFDVVVINNGSAPARDVLVEAQLINAGPGQDEQIGRFFREPVGTGERLAMIPPMGRVSIKTRLTISGEDLVPVEMGGRQLFVPLVAFNALYRWSGGEEQDSASFLVGRGDQPDGKMAPFRLDLGARSWSGLGARPHSMGLQRA